VLPPALFAASRRNKQTPFPSPTPTHKDRLYTYLPNRHYSNNSSNSSTNRSLTKQKQMALGPRANAVLDVAHRAVVGVLALSAAYFTVEIFRASWAIQEHKFEHRQQGQQQQGQQDGAAKRA
jgi:hypothetical protein